MTGAAMPKGADAVVMIEHIKREGRTITLDRAAKKGEHFVPRGTEAREGWNKNAIARAERLEREGLPNLANASAEVRQVRHRSADGLAKAARGMLTQRDAGVMNSLASVAVPSLIVVGADDTPFLAASDYMAAKIPGAKKVVIQHAGHAANIDQPEAFNRALLEFLDGLA